VGHARARSHAGPARRLTCDTLTEWVTFPPSPLFSDSFGGSVFEEARVAFAEDPAPALAAPLTELVALPLAPGCEPATVQRELAEARAVLEAADGCLGSAWGTDVADERRLFVVTGWASTEVGSRSPSRASSALTQRQAQHNFAASQAARELRERYIGSGDDASVSLVHVALEPVDII
jgi:hypothetical protein